MLIIARKGLGDVIKAANGNQIKRCILKRGVWIAYLKNGRK